MNKKTEPSANEVLLELLENEEYQKVYHFLYTYLYNNPKMIFPFIEDIGNKRWVVVSIKNKIDRITIHVYDKNLNGNKPIYFDDQMNIYEDGKKARKEIQAVLRNEMNKFINKYFGKKE